ncbi:hypothetical protein EL23_25570 [Paenibacillus polymyxa]|nr:hypothetical protein EL23_25570 [Paenibacillus polymyxa]
MLELFIDTIFERKDLELNKIYATVAACNQASIKLLKNSILSWRELIESIIGLVMVRYAINIIILC